MIRILITSLTLMLTVAAVAAPPGRPDREQRGARGQRGERLARVHDLSESQRASIEALRETLKATMEPLVEQRRANREALKAALDAGDTAKAGELAMANHNLRSQFKAAHESFETSFAALLTAEQKAKWEMAREMRQSRRHRR